jgi:hypothetical protein
MSTSRIKGLVALVAAGVEHGSAAIEKVQLATAARTFDILEHIPPLAKPTRVVRAAHDVSVKATHVSIRLVTAIVKGGADLAIDAATSGTAEAASHAEDEQPEP